jgi:hypothetical protein
MTTKPLPPNIKAAITRFDNAAQNYGALDSYAPEKRTAIIHQHQSAKDALVSIIERNLR